MRPGCRRWPEGRLAGTMTATATAKVDHRQSGAARQGGSAGATSGHSEEVGTQVDPICLHVGSESNRAGCRASGQSLLP